MYSVKGKKEYQIEKTDGQWTINGKPFDFNISKEDSENFTILSDDKAYQAEIESISEDRKEVVIKVNHVPYTLQIKDRLDLLVEGMGMNNIAGKKSEDLKAPMPGMILEVQVKKGDFVEKGQNLIILEAMKMENIIKAGHDGEIKEVLVEKGKSVEKNQVLIRF